MSCRAGRRVEGGRTTLDRPAPRWSEDADKTPAPRDGEAVDNTAAGVNECEMRHKWPEPTQRNISKQRGQVVSQVGTLLRYPGWPRRRSNRVAELHISALHQVGALEIRSWRGRRGPWSVVWSSPAHYIVVRATVVRAARITAGPRLKRFRRQCLASARHDHCLMWPKGRVVAIQMLGRLTQSHLARNFGNNSVNHGCARVVLS